MFSDVSRSKRLNRGCGSSLGQIVSHLDSGGAAPQVHLVPVLIFPHLGEWLKLSYSRIWNLPL
jgi:hypothetical protein